MEALEAIVSHLEMPSLSLMQEAEQEMTRSNSAASAAPEHVDPQCSARNLDGRFGGHSRVSADAGAGYPSTSATQFRWLPLHLRRPRKARAISLRPASETVSNCNKVARTVTASYRGEPGA